MSLNPLVSILMTSYNRERLIGEAIESVLAQTFTDFELLISDDGSGDDSVGVISAISDPRIRLFPNAENRGACIVTNELIERASGQYVALINSDDEWVPEKLRTQFEFMEKNPAVGACFSQVSWIDRDGRPLDDAAVSFGTVFKQPNRSKQEWLRHFFFKGNCLCHPSVLIRRECYQKLGLYDNRLRQLPDFEMWVRVVKKYDLHILDAALVRFRVLPGENVSSPTAANLQRSNNELFFIFRSFFDGVSASLLRGGFGDLMLTPDADDEVDIDIEKAFLYFSPGLWNQGIYQVIALDKLHSMLARETHRHVLQARYKFDDRAFQARSAATITFKLPGVPAAVDLEKVAGRDMISALLRRVSQRLGVTKR
ncbi:MAG: glycosyltransferase [Comamonadaceae bacterium]|nr:MAG: glycosyltransferase [Comamonadaceae bacterium]